MSVIPNDENLVAFERFLLYARMTALECFPSHISLLLLTSHAVATLPP
jgi:hypothetical protein